MNRKSTRNFVALTPQKRPEMPPPPVPSSSKPQRGKRKARTVTDKDARKKRKTKGKGKARAEENEKSTSSNGDSDSDFNPFNAPQPQRPRRTAKTLARVYREEDINVDPVPDTTDAGQAIDIDMIVTGTSNEVPSNNMDIDMVPEVPPASAMALELEIEEEEKPKPILQLKYQGFGIYGHCLCIVVEPWPPIRSTSKAPSTIAPLPTLSREPSLAPQSFRQASEQPRVQRAKTPLFLPDDFDRGDTPAPFRGESGTPASSSLFDPRFLEDSDSEDDGGMMLFSQVLNDAGDSRAGAANDDEDDNMDTGMFFGDADEAREL
ncbi:hypothetical protein DXG03_000308 [Asterophora parasitica]|uniref:Uncharacterized protein n=1 Tax=Asterophora parasitica TaxID=117018 RepID=A0A9P7KGS7_9AGAR|nr:hypothetical protein DXG03_000308 [Asterophora parasitica]